MGGVRSAYKEAPRVYNHRRTTAENRREKGREAPIQDHHRERWRPTRSAALAPRRPKKSNRQRSPVQRGEVLARSDAPHARERDGQRPPPQQGQPSDADHHTHHQSGTPGRPVRGYPMKTTATGGGLPKKDARPYTRGGCIWPIHKATAYKAQQGDYMRGCYIPPPDPQKGRTASRSRADAANIAI